MAKIWSFDPDDTYTPTKSHPYKRRRGKKDLDWCAPEHVKFARDMRRDYPRNEKGERIEGKSKELVIDKRPTIMVPPRPTIIGYK